MRIVAGALGAAVCSVAILATAGTAAATPGGGKPGGGGTGSIPAVVCQGEKGRVEYDKYPDIPGSGTLLIGYCRGGKYDGRRVLG